MTDPKRPDKGPEEGEAPAPASAEAPVSPRAPASAETSPVAAGPKEEAGNTGDAHDEGDGDAGPDSTRHPKDVDALASLLRRSLAGGPSAAAANEPDLLRGVQRRIRKRSQGKFFADGWSTAEGRVSHALIAAAMLLILVVAFFALGPIGVQ